MTRTMAQRHENASTMVESFTAPAHDPSPSPSPSSTASPGHVSSGQLHTSASTTADDLGSSPPPLRTLTQLLLKQFEPSIHHSGHDCNKIIINSFNSTSFSFPTFVKIYVNISFSIHSKFIFKFQYIIFLLKTN